MIEALIAIILTEGLREIYGAIGTVARVPSIS